MLNNLTSLSNIQKSLVLMGVGIAGVFLVLIVFYMTIKLLERLFPEKDNSKEET